MNASNAKDFLPLVQALAEGRTVQSLSSNEWRDTSEFYFGNDPSYYRIKPEPKTVPWEGPGDVPFPALFRRGSSPSVLMPILARWSNGFSVADSRTISTVTFFEALNNGKVSTDGGKTWGPCGKVVAQ